MRDQDEWEDSEADDTFDTQVAELFGGAPRRAVPQTDAEMRVRATAVAELFPELQPQGAAHTDPTQAIAHLFDDDEQIDAALTDDDALVDDDTQIMATQPVRAGQASAQRMPLRMPRNWRRIGLITGGIALILAIAGGGTAWALSAKMSADAAVTVATEELVDAEHDLANQIEQVNASIDSLRRDIATHLTEVESFAHPLAAMAGVSDEPARAAAEIARTEYAALLAGITVPEAVEPYRRDIGMGADGLERIEALQSSVAARTQALSQQESDVAAIRSTVAQADTAFRTAITTFTATLPTYAEMVNSENPEAEETYRAAVTKSADAVASSSAFIDRRDSLWNTYVTAVAALRADEERAVAERIAEEEARARQNVQPNPPPAPSPEPAPTTPPPEPSPSPEPTPSPSPGESDSSGT